ncbi:hypothetical protein QBC41DRAFT_282277 [Cercophora samala]|uniref:Uncharacterized protein n=1 Tax=Cercophora samala TaxID=330535 RepID=A0AA39Z7Q0_9PEZI|nr:hypothetical protein QBC41DRAFT_282277 [Cercophora samala]
MTKTGMSFVQVIRTFRLGASEAGELMNLVGAEQRKIDSFDEEVKKHLHTADLTWMDEYNKTHTPLITDHLTAKEIRQAKAFMNFMGFKDIASKLGEYVGVGTGRRFPIVLNHFWGDGFKDLPPHFKVFCSEELGEMASTWNDLQRKHPPRLSTPEMHVRLDPPPGTINPRRLLNDPEPFSSARYPLGGHNLAHRAHINEPLIQDPSLQVASSTPSFPPSLYGSRSHGVPTVNAGYHHSGRTQPVGRPQHGLPVFLPDPGYGVPINPFATLPPPSMPHNPGHAQYGSWQPYFQVQYEPQFPEGPQHQQMYQDRGSYWGPPSYYREPENIHFTMAMGEDQSPRPAPLIIRRPYSPLPARHQQPSDIDVIESEQDWEFNLSPAFGHGFRRAPGSNNMEAPHIADLQPHRRPPGPMGHHPQQVADRGLGDLIDLTSDPRRSMGTARGAVQQGTNPSRMGYVPRGQFSNTTGALGMTPAGELSRQNIASSSRSEVPLLNTAQLAMLYNTYDQPRPSTGTLDHAVDNVRTSDAQQAKHIPSEPLLNYPRHEIQQRDPRLQKQVDQWRNKFQNTWTPEPESGSEFDSQDHEEEAVPSVPARPTRTRKVQDDDDSDDDFVLRRDEEVQEKQQEKRRRVSLPARSRKSAVSAVSASAGTSTRPRGALKKSADVAAPVVGATNKRKAAQTGESQAAPKKRRVNNEASSTHTGSSTSRTQRRRSAPADDGFSDGGEEYDDGKKSKPARGRRQPGGVWGNADTMFTNGRGGFMKRSEVAALPNTKYRPGGSFGGGKWLEEDTGVLWLPVNPSEQCRKNLVENATPPEPALGAREKTVKKDTKLTTQAVKKTIRLVSQVAAPSSSQISSSQATNSSATIGHSSPAKAPEPESFEEFLSSRGFYTREKFETDSLFWAYISALGPPFSTHPGAPTLGPPPKGKSLDNYIPAETRAHHEAYLAAQEAAGDETHQQQDTESEEQGGQTAQETSQEGVHKTTRTTTKESPEESIGEAAKDIQQTPQVREAEKTDLPDLLRNQGLDLDKPPALDTTEKLARYSTRLRSAVFGLLPRSRGSSSGSRSASPATETPGKKLTTKDAEVKEGAAKEAASKNTAEEADTEDAATEDQNPVNPGTSAGVMTIRTLRPRKGKEVDRGNTLAEPLEKKVCGK